MFSFVASTLQIARSLGRSVAPSLGRSDSEGFERASRHPSRAWRFLAFPLLSVAILAGIGCWYFGSPAVFWAFVRGETLIVTPRRQVLADSKAGDVATVSFTVWNLGRKPMTLVGASSRCTCTATLGLPIAVPGIQQRPVAVEFRITPGVLGREQQVVYFTDSRDQPRVAVSLLATRRP